jgi:hypothetical protein
VIIRDAIRIEKDLQLKSGMVIVRDPSTALHWEEKYFALTTENDTIGTPPPNIPTEPTGGLRRDKTRSIIDLTAASDSESPPEKKVGSKVEVVVKQEMNDDEIVAKVTGMDKGPAKLAWNGVTGGGTPMSPQKPTATVMEAEDSRRRQRPRRSQQTLLMDSRPRHKKNARCLASTSSVKPRLGIARTG